MPIAERGWSDRNENYADSYSKAIVGTTATAIMGVDYTQPAVIYSLSVYVGNAGATGDVMLVDGSATGDAGDTRVLRVHIASGAGGEQGRHLIFPRGLIFDKGIIVSATTVTGAVSLTYKPRYA